MGFFISFHACGPIADKLKDSATYVAMDNYFPSPIPFQCQAIGNGVFAVGTLRANFHGVGDAHRYWKLLGQRNKEKGRQVFHAIRERTFRPLEIFETWRAPLDYPHPREALCAQNINVRHKIVFF